MFKSNPILKVAVIALVTAAMSAFVYNFPQVLGFVLNKEFKEKLKPYDESDKRLFSKLACIDSSLFRIEVKFIGLGRDVKNNNRLLYFILDHNGVAVPDDLNNKGE